MSSKQKLMIIGISPMIIGYIVNIIVINLKIYGMGYLFIGILFLLYWYFMGYKSCKYSKNSKEALIFANLFGFLNLLFVFFQVIVSNSFYGNLWGFLPQMYFLPMVNIVARIDFLNILNNVPKIFTGGYIIMVIVFYFGLKKGKNHSL